MGNHPHWLLFLLVAVTVTTTCISADVESSDMVEVEIDSKVFHYSIMTNPPVDSAVVQAEKETLRGALDLESFVKDLGRVGKYIRVAYNGIAAAEPRFQGLKTEVQKLGFGISKLCDKFAVTIASFKTTTAAVLFELKVAYQFFLKNREFIALDSFSEIAELAGKMATTAENLQREFESQDSEVLGTLDQTQRMGAEDKASRSMKQLIHLLRQAALFWNQLKQHCQVLSDDKLQNKIKKLVKEFSEEERKEYWTSNEFKQRMFFYISKWVALHSVSSDYFEYIKLTQQDLYKYILENPTREESRRNLRALAENFEDDLASAQEEIEKRNAKADEEIQQLVAQQKTEKTEL